MIQTKTFGRFISPLFLALATGCSVLPIKPPDKVEEPVLSPNQKAFYYLQNKRRSDIAERLMDRLSIQSYQMYKFKDGMDAEDCENFEDSEFPEDADNLKKVFESSTSEEVIFGGETRDGRKKRLKDFYDAYSVAIGNFFAISETCQYK